MSTFTNAEAQIQALYVGYFGRAGDPAGMNYWLSQYDAGMSIAAIAASFSVQTEATNLYPFLKNPLVDDAAHDNAAAFINSVFEDLFNRGENAIVDPTGFAYWLARVVGAASNPQAIGQIIEDIISGATGVDNTTLQNKVTVGDFFTNDLAGSTQPYVGNAINISQSSVGNTTSDPTTVTTQETVITNFINNVPPLPGVYSNLTTNTDHVVITSINTIDHVQGLIDTTVGSTDSTYTGGDNIHGNGLTNVDLTVTGNVSGSAALASMAGVAQVNFFMGTTKDLSVNAVLWKNVGSVTLAGTGADVSVSHLNTNNGNGIKLAAMAATGNGYLHASGHVSGLTYSADVENHNGVGSVATFGTSGVDAVIGKSGTASIELYHKLSNAASKGNASVGDINIGNVNVNVGSHVNDADVKIYNEAIAYSHNATAGNITVGAVNLTAAKGGVIDFTVDNSAYAYTKGNATVGNVTVGNIAVHLAKSASGYLDFYADNTVAKGTGTDGNLTIGNISFSGGADQDVYIYRYVNDSTGNATVGNITIGNVSMIGGTSSPEISIEYNGADVGKGNATAGNITIGNVNMSASSYEAIYIQYQGAKVDTTGNATTGNVTIGNVTMHAKTYQAENLVYVDNYAEAGYTGGKGGVATGGNVSIGNITQTGSYENYVDVYNLAANFGSKSHNAAGGSVTIGNITGMQVVGLNSTGAAVTGVVDQVYIENHATADHGNGSVGNVTIGNISVNAVAPSFQAGAVAEVTIYNGVHAVNGKATVGSVTVGNVTQNVGLAGKASLYVSNYANGNTSANSTGLVKIGNVSMQGGSGADVKATVYNYAYDGLIHLGTTGGINIGNVTLVLTKALGTAKLDVSETGSTAGQITVGNVSVQGHTGAKLDVTVSELAGKGGTATGVTIGNVSLTGAKATAVLSVTETGGTTGAVKVGNVSMNAGKLHMSISNSATGGNAGGLSVGNVTLKGNSTTTNYISQHATNGNAGALTVGNIGMTIGKGQDMKLLVTNSALNHVGTVTVGNVSLAIANTKAGGANHATLDISSSSVNAVPGGNIAVGNIAISAGGESKSFAAANMAVHMVVHSHDGTVSVGNISVSGGLLNTAGPTVLDNFADFSNGSDGLSPWLTLTGTSHATVGSIDYSGYVGAGAYSNGTVDGIAAKAAGTIIDVNTLKGAGSIIGSSGGTAIVDNSGQNAIDVSHAAATTKADIILLQDSQTAVSDNGTVVTAPQASVDSIIGIHSGDVIGFAAGNYATGFGLTGAMAPTQGGASTYAIFLATAETYIDTNGYSFYSADVGGNTFVAMNNGGHVAEVVEVMGIHTFSVDGSNFLHFAT